MLEKERIQREQCLKQGWPNVSHDPKRHTAQINVFLIPVRVTRIRKRSDVEETCKLLIVRRV